MKKQAGDPHTALRVAGKSVYSRAPLYFHGTIPVFSKRNEFIKNYEKIARDHLNATHGTCHNPWIDENSWRTMEMSTLDLARKWLKPGDRILDVGVGLGRLLEMLPNYESYGMDIALSYLELAEKKGITVCMAMIEDLPYKEKIFDIVICTDVLEHVINFDLCVNNILSVLKPGGVLVLRVPYKEPLEPYTEKSYPYYYAHLRIFNEHSLTLQFTRCFECDILDYNYALYLPDTDRFRYRIPTRLSGKLQRGFLKSIRKIYPSKYDYMLEKLFEPAVISIAVRKRNH